MEFRMRQTISTKSPMVDLSAAKSLVVRMRTLQFQFLTCDGRKNTEGITFLALLSPFDLHIWLFILISYVLVSVLMCTIVNMKRTSGDSALAIYSIILEHSHRDALNPKNLLPVYLFLTPWLLGGIVITNCYKGIVTTHLTLPLKVDLLKNFAQLANRNFTVFVRPFVSDLDMYEIFSHQTGKWDESSIFVHYIHEQQSSITYSRFQEVKNTFKLVDKNSFANESYVNSILNCSQSAIADWSDTIEQEYHQLLTKDATIGKYVA